MVPTSVSASSSAQSGATGGTSGGATTGDFIVNSPGAKSDAVSGLMSKPLLLIAGIAALGVVLWLARRK